MIVGSINYLKCNKFHKKKGQNQAWHWKGVVKNTRIDVAKKLNYYMAKDNDMKMMQTIIENDHFAIGPYE